MVQSKNDVKLGKFLSLVLRHNPDAAGISLDEHGWADVAELLNGVCDTGRQLSLNGMEKHSKEIEQHNSFAAPFANLSCGEGCNRNLYWNLCIITWIAKFSQKCIAKFLQKLCCVLLDNAI